MNMVLSSLPELVALRAAVEQHLGARVGAPSDFDRLSLAIWESLHENISPTTLKRFWGYLDGGQSVRRSTLCLLSRYVGFADWEAFLLHLGSQSEVESESFLGDGVFASRMQPGTRVLVSWMPNRRCIFRYLGDMRFEVVVNENSKLSVGDTFEAAAFLLGRPFYANRLRRVGQSDETNYMAGRKHGLTHVEIL